MFGKLFQKTMLRNKCSCGGKGNKFESNYFRCNKCQTVWDGRDEFTQAKVLIRECTTVIRDI